MAFFGKRNAQDWLEELMGTIVIEEKTNAQQAKIREVAFYTAVGLIADMVSGCEVQVLEGGKPVKNANWYTFNVSANPNQSGRELLCDWIVNYYYSGTGLMVPLTGNLYVADSFSVEELPLKGDVYSGISINGYQIKRTFKADKAYVLHQPGRKNAKKLIDGAFASYSDLLNASRASYVKNSGEKYVLQTGAFPSGDSEQSMKFREDTAASLKKFFDTGPDSAAVYPATKNQTLTRLSAAANGASASDYASIRKDVYAIVASALHLPTSLLDGTSTATEQIFNQALTTAIDPLAAKISAELTRKTYSRDQVLYNGCRVYIDTSDIKHTDVLDAADKIDKLISSGYMCIDEVRDRTGQPEIGEDWSQTHFITKNYGSLANGADPLKGGE